MDTNCTLVGAVANDIYDSKWTQDIYFMYLSNKLYDIVMLIK